MSKWETDPVIADMVETITVDDISMTKLKKDYEITNKSQSLKVNFFSLCTVAMRKMLNPGKLVRLTAMVFTWIPQANNLKGKTTISLIDGRKSKTDANRIESQVTIRPGRPAIGVFYHNYAMNIDDLSYMDLEFVMHGVNIERGTVGRLSFGYKTMMSGPTFYQPKKPEVFYLPVETLPELSVETPNDIYKNTIEKIKKRKNKEIEYFTNLKNFIDMTQVPLNDASTSQDTIIEDLSRDLEILNKYQEDANKYNIKKDKVAGLETAIENTKNKINLLKSGSCSSVPEISIHGDEFEI
nr:movement protein [Clematis yellow mottle associated virus]